MDENLLIWQPGAFWETVLCPVTFLKFPFEGSLVINMAEVTDREEVRKEMGMTPEEFYAAPREPPSSSSLPIFDAAHVRDAMARFDQTDFHSEAEKIHAYKAIVAAAHKFGIEVDEFKKYNPE